MNEPKWTKGPWRTAATGAKDLAVYGKSSKEPVCVFVYGDDLSDNYELRNAAANAQLTAVAPELYEALCGLLNMNEVDNIADLKQWGAAAANRIAFARAALAKARGG